MAKPAWCVKPKPCDYDENSAYCPHRECRQNLVAGYDQFLHQILVAGDISPPEGSGLSGLAAREGNGE